MGELQSDANFLRLRPIQQSALQERYKLVPPDRVENLLDTNRGVIQVGPHEFCSDASLIFDGLLEILYALRCLLFHGEIEPTKRYRDIYEPAYFILRRFLWCIE